MQQIEAEPPFEPVWVQTLAQHVPLLQNPEQQSVSAAQLLPALAQQEPFLHVSVSVHTLLQAPQFSGSEFVSTQVPLHAVFGGEHAHCPPWHVWPPAQTVPQSPQWRASVCVSTQLPAQQ